MIDSDASKWKVTIDKIETPTGTWHASKNPFGIGPFGMFSIYKKRHDREHRMRKIAEFFAPYRKTVKCCFVVVAGTVFIKSNKWGLPVLLYIYLCEIVAAALMPLKLLFFGCILIWIRFLVWFNSFQHLFLLLLFSSPSPSSSLQLDHSSIWKWFRYTYAIIMSKQQRKK